ncbi:energy transducer TonB [Croceimicrobium hydrocarbonivorans]|uniref:Energy transducer TonB n=1 Tax=Croceimicrobium hydrocarbonivorans TaxID=2761580 RepID=A0A7H0VF10_9FLAO|nr:energy transducer TonB [Croceimicrobium hydrocarbonivorans]QNR24308.1 energy transducer TonB [Croceimicrobium hydrocarbonivorans]
MLKAEIKEACPADWNKMKIGVHSRFCESCAKNVIDFSASSRVEILSYLLEHRGEQVCGRMKRSEVDFSYDDIMVTIQALSQKPQHRNKAFYFLALASLYLASCDEPNDPDRNSSYYSPRTLKMASDSIPIEVQINADSLKPNSAEVKTDCHLDTHHQIENADSLPIEISSGLVTLGDINLPLKESGEGDSLANPDSWQSYDYHQVEVQPEFPGGIDSLMAFLRKEVEYPQIMVKEKIEGKVYVQIVISKEGKVTSPEIVRNGTGYTAAEEAVLKALVKMPLWKVGQIEGKAVNSRMIIPVSFRLD